MENATKQLEILKKLTDARNQLSALWSLFNSSLLTAEEYRAGTVSCFEKMLDLKNTINLLSNELFQLSKKERAERLSSSLGKIKGYKRQVGEIDSEYEDSYVNYNNSLKECLRLKASLTADVKSLCDEFKDTVDASTPNEMKKGYNNQIKLIKKIIMAIDNLRADYNVKKNSLEERNPSYLALKDSVSSLLNSLEKSA